MAVPWDAILGLIGGVGSGLMAPEQQQRQSFGADRVTGVADAFQNNFNVLNAMNRSSLGASPHGPVTPNLFSGMPGGGAIDFGRLPGSGREQTLGADYGSAIDQVNERAQANPHFLGTPSGIDVPNSFGASTFGSGGAGFTGGGGLGGGGTTGAAAAGGNPAAGGFIPPGEDGTGGARPTYLEPGESFGDPDAQFGINEGAGVYDGPNGGLGGIPWGTILDIIGAGAGIPGLGSLLGRGGGNPQGEQGGTGGIFTMDQDFGGFQTFPGMARQVPGQPGQPVPIMAHGGELVGRPPGAPQAGPPAPVPGQAPPQQPAQIAPPPAGGFAAPPPALTTGATMPQTGQPVPQGGQPPSGAAPDDEQYISAASLLGALGAV